jgi:hypothetical protein
MTTVVAISWISSSASWVVWFTEWFTLRFTVLNEDTKSTGLRTLKHDLVSLQMLPILPFFSFKGTLWGRGSSEKNLRFRRRQDEVEFFAKPTTTHRKWEETPDEGVGVFAHLRHKRAETQGGQKNYLSCVLPLSA